MKAVSSLSGRSHSFSRNGGHVSRFNTANVLTGVLTFCAVIVTALLVRRELFASRSNTAATAMFARRSVQDWQALAGEGTLIGSAAAPYKFIEFADFQCPYCKDLHFTLEKLVRENPAEIAVLYRHFPLPNHVHAVPAATAAECAARQGRFAEYATLLFQFQDSIGHIGWDTLASRAGVGNVQAFRDCHRNGEAKARVERDTKAAASIGASGTPTIVLRNQMVAGAMPADTLLAWLASVKRERRP